MSKNTGKEYELLTKAIFQQLLEQDNVETTRLEHHVVLEGKTTSHQIDVYWVFEAGGVEYHTIVQAKDWTQTVSQSTVMTFKGVMDDLKFNAHGIMVTRTGYQQGAKDYAEGHGIALYELREITDADFDQRLKTIVLRVHILTPDLKGFEVEPDRQWMARQKALHSLPDDEPVEISGLSGTIELADDEGNSRGTIADHLKPYTAGLKPDTDKTFTHQFEPPVLIPTVHERVRQVRLLGMKGRVVSVCETLEHRFSLGDMTRFILKNVLGDKSRLFTKNGDVIE